MTIGAELERERSLRGLSLEQVASATRVRRAHLAALESWSLDQLPGPVYARGYLKTYAGFLDLDPERMLSALPEGGEGKQASLSMGRLAPPSAKSLALTVPLLAAAGMLVLVALFGLYAWRQFDSLKSLESPGTPARVPAPPIASPPPLTDPVAAPQVAPAPAGRVVLAFVHVTEQAWINVQVDGQPVFGASGRFLDAGATAVFAGRRVAVTTGKGASTFVTVDGRELGAVGSVAGREYTAQN